MVLLLPFATLSIRRCFHHCRSPMLISLCHLIQASFFCCLLETGWSRMSSCVTFRSNLHIWHEIEQLKKDPSGERSWVDASWLVSMKYKDCLSTCAAHSISFFSFFFFEEKWHPSMLFKLHIVLY